MVPRDQEGKNNEKDGITYDTYDGSFFSRLRREW